MSHFDAVVVGAGAGGLLTAARLADGGARVLVVERLARVGGRASTIIKDGFSINTGAIVVERGTALERTFDDVGADFVVRQPNPPLVYRFGQRDLNITTGVVGGLVDAIVRSSCRALLRWSEPAPGLSAHDWLHGLTRNEAVHGLLRNFIGSVFAADPRQLPASLLVRYLGTRTAFRRFGFVPGGTGQIWAPLVERVRRANGDVWLEAEVEGLGLSRGLVRSVDVRRPEGRASISTEAVVSNAGPAATARWLGRSGSDGGGGRDVPSLRPGSLITVNFCSRRRLLDFPGLACLGETRRLCYLANFTDTCPEMAPDGWHLYCGAGVPRAVDGEFDRAAETQLLLEDLREHVVGFEPHAEVLSVVVMSGDWPAQRAIAGSDRSHRTSIPNLWNVGDGVKPWAHAGLTACAEIASVVAAEVVAYRARHPSSRPRG